MIEADNKHLKKLSVILAKRKTFFPIKTKHENTRSHQGNERRKIRGATVFVILVTFLLKY